MLTCSLCKTQVQYEIIPNYFHCGSCDLRFLDPKMYINSDEEKKRYLLHDNDVQNLNYQKFTQPMVDLVIQHQTRDQRGLDFGAGAGPVASHMLEKLGYAIDKYDPYFWPNTEVFANKYNYIISTEVVEHLHNPHQEFLRLKNLLIPGSNLFVKTVLYDLDIDFGTWYYRKDPTHVVFYSRKTMEWIHDSFNFSKLSFYPNNIMHFRC